MQTGVKKSEPALTPVRPAIHPELSSLDFFINQPSRMAALHHKPAHQLARRHGVGEAQVRQPTRALYENVSLQGRYFAPAFRIQVSVLALYQHRTTTFHPEI
jgi:hypothetical protein